VVDRQALQVSAKSKDGGRRALVVGGNGAAGSAIIQALQDDGGWEIHSLNRSPARVSEANPAVVSVQASLLDEAALRVALRDCGAITHVFYAARLVAPSLDEEIAINTKVFATLVNSALDLVPELRHVVLIEGTKWYGSHLGHYPVPAVESHSTSQPYFYHHQQAMLEKWALEGRLSWTAFRPHTLLSDARRTDHNLLLLLAFYASVMAERGETIPFPGTLARYTLPTTASNTDTLGEACAWSAEAASARNQAFNINNGDSLLWAEVWPRICEFFGRQAAEPGGTSLRECMPGSASAWRKIVQRHALVETSWPSEAEWAYADGIVRPDRPDIIDISKLKSAGFDPTASTLDSILNILGRFRHARLIP